MTTRRPFPWPAACGTALYALAYLGAWNGVWRVAPANRDGMEWIGVALLTMPWTLLVGIGGTAVIHVGSVVNAVLAGVLATRVARQYRGRGGLGH